MANFVVSGTPHVRSKESIQSIMRDVIIALVPATAAGIYYFGLRALILIVAAIISAVFFEWHQHSARLHIAGSILEDCQLNSRQSRQIIRILITDIRLLADNSQT